MPEIISIVGKSGSGKTTLLEKLIPALKRRGLRIGTIKHAAHGIDADRKGKDSWRHRQAGADTVVVAGPETVVMVKTAGGGGIDALAVYFQDVDLVLTEGFKREDRPKIEIFRTAAHSEPLCLGDRRLIAFVSDAQVDPGVPLFGLEAVEALADFIVETCLPAAGAATANV
jgi:molybdopterin-guanine dinucleotide biosynthesis protein B